jgi:hypothetical protein
MAAGALTPAARERLDAARVLVVGTGGIGGTVACELARAGVGSLLLVDFDRYEAGNLNRQIACNRDSIGQPKAEVLAAAISRMGTVDRVEAIMERRRADGFVDEIAASDLVIAAADDYAFSLALMDRALGAGKPAGAALPVGFWAATCLLLLGGPAPASLFGLRTMADEEGYAAEIMRRRAPLAAWMRRRSGAPWTEALADFAADRGRPPQLCPVVWTAASLLVLEAVKLLSGAARPVVAPRWLEVSARGAATRTSLAGLLGARAKAAASHGKGGKG